MKRIIAILAVSVCVLIFLIFFGLHIFLNIYGKSFLVREVQNRLGRKTTIQSLNVTFPLNLNIKKIDIEGIFKADDIYLSPSLVGFLINKIILNEFRVINPTIYLERTAQGSLEAPFLRKKEDTAKAESKRYPRTKIFSAVRNLKLVNGKITYLDKKIKPEGLKVELKALNIDIQNIFVLPYSIITRFQLKGAMPWAEDIQQNGTISFTGWVDLRKKDGKAELRIENIDAVYLYPYYNKFVSLEKTSIEKANLHFLSNMTASNNNLTSDCHLELGQLVFKENQSTEESPRFGKDRVSRILDIFKSAEGRIVLDFVIRTRLDKPIFGIDNIRMAVDDKISKNHKNGVKPEDVLKVPGKVVAGAVQGTAEVSKAFVSGISSLGLEIKKALEAAFRREDKEEKNNK